MPANHILRAQARLLFSDVFRIARGGFIGQVPFILVSPALTRLYSPAQIGIYGLAMAFVGVAGPVAGLRFELAAISATDPVDSRNLLLLSALCALPVALICSAVLYALKSAGAGSYDRLSWAVVAACIASVWIAGVYSTMRCRSVRHHEFRAIARSLTVQGTLRAGVPLALAALSRGSLMLLVSELVARFASTWVLARNLKLVDALTKSRIALRYLGATARQFWKYPLLLTPSALIDATAVALPVPIVASCYGLAAAGEFALVQRLVMLPATFVASSVGDVYHAHATRIARSEAVDLRALTTSTAVRLSIFAVAVYAPVALLAPFGAEWVFGRPWAQAGGIIAALSPACVAQAVVSPLSRGLLLAGREERKLIADFVCLILPSSALYVSRGLSLPSAVLVYSVGSVVAFGVYFMIIAWALREVGRSGGKSSGDS